MNTIEFVKKFGLDKARDIVNGVTKFKDYRKPTHFDSDLNIYHDFKVLDESDVSIADIEQIVRAFEWVEKFGGLDGFKDEYMSRIENNECVSGMSMVIDLVEM